MMKSFRWGRAFATLFGVALLALVAALALVWAALPLDHTSLTIDGETFALSDLDGWHVVPIVVGAAVALVFGLVVAALAIVFALGVAALGIAVSVIAVLASLVLAASPFLFVGWLVWLLLRPARGGVAAAA